MENKTGAVLLSGGLDSFISLDLAVREADGMDVKVALTFNYGQIAFEDELAASSAIAARYNIPHKVIELPFLAQMLDSSEVWVPNRNGLFLNIACCFADKYNYDYIIFGANAEEGREFSDNCAEFVKIADDFFSFSTLKKPKIYSPLKNLNKTEIINLGIKNGIDFSLLKSCYNAQKETGKKHCGICKSCLHLKNALSGCNNKDLIKQIF